MLNRWTALFALVLAFLCAPPSHAENAAGETVAYIFKKDDTLNSIAGKYLISTNSALQVQRLNGIKDATKIRPGTVLKIPVTLLKSTPMTAKVVAFSGNVTIAGSKGSVAPSIGSGILESQTIITGAPGFLTMAVSDGSKVSLPSNSRVKILRLRRYVLTGGNDIDLFVERGRAETTAAPVRNPNSKFRMRTPTAVSAVRGTVFRFGYEGPEGSSLTEVVEGAVAVDAGKSATPTVLPNGFGAALPKTGNLLKEQLLPPPAILNSGSLQADAKVMFRLSAVSGAKGYHTQVARDAGFLEMIAEDVSVSPVASFDSVPDGTFFVRAMAIADSGLEGLSDTFAFRRRYMEIGATEASAPTGDTFQINWIDQGATNTIYRFQLFAADDAAIPLVDEPGLEATGITLTNLPPGTYRWRVNMRQNTADGPVDIWSQPQMFTIDK